MKRDNIYTYVPIIVCAALFGSEGVIPRTIMKLINKIGWYDQMSGVHLPCVCCTKFMYVVSLQIKLVLIAGGGGESRRYLRRAWARWATCSEVQVPLVFATEKCSLWWATGFASLLTCFFKVFSCDCAFDGHVVNGSRSLNHELYDEKMLL